MRTKIVNTFASVRLTRWLTINSLECSSSSALVIIYKTKRSTSELEQHPSLWWYLIDYWRNLFCVAGTKYDLLLDRRSKVRGIQKTSSKDFWLLVGCGRRDEVTGSNKFLFSLMDQLDAHSNKLQKHMRAYTRTWHRAQVHNCSFFYYDNISSKETFLLYKRR